MDKDSSSPLNPQPTPIEIPKFPPENQPIHPGNMNQLAFLQSNPQLTEQYIQTLNFQYTQFLLHQPSSTNQFNAQYVQLLTQQYARIPHDQQKPFGNINPLQALKMQEYINALPEANRPIGFLTALKALTKVGDEQLERLKQKVQYIPQEGAAPPSFIRKTFMFNCLSLWCLCTCSMLSLPKPFCFVIICLIPHIIILTVFRLLFAIPTVVFTVDEGKRTLKIESRALQCFCCCELDAKIYKFDEIVGADVVDIQREYGIKEKFVAMIYNDGSYQLVSDNFEKCPCCCMRKEVNLINDLIVRFKANFGEQIMKCKDFEREATLG